VDSRLSHTAVFHNSFYMTETRRTFSREFKLKAVELSYKRENIRDLAHELDIRPELLCRWRKEFGSTQTESFPGNGKKKMDAQESENARLRKELADMRMERDILKKAVGIFSKNDGKYSNS
jgi:transposase